MNFSLANIILNLLSVRIDYRWVQARFPLPSSLKRTEFSVTLRHGQATVSTLFLGRTCALISCLFFGETGDNLGVKSLGNALFYSNRL